MGKCVAHHAIGLPISFDRLHPIAIALRAPTIIGKPAHPAQHPFALPSDQQNCALMLDPKGFALADGLRLLGRLNRQARRIAVGARFALLHQRAGQAFGIARCANRRTQIHHRLGKIAAMRIRSDRFHGLSNRLSSSGQRRLNRE